MLYPDDSTEHGTGAAVRAGILPGGLLARGPRAALPPGQHRLERISGQGRHPAQRYPPHPGGARAHAHPARRSAVSAGTTAWDLTQRTLAYTNHTLLPEALERWPLHCFQQIVPRQLEIIFEINRRFLDDVRRRYPGDEARVARMSLIEEGPERQGAHGQPGDRRLAQHQRRRRHPFASCCARPTVKDFAEMFPERFNNKTNGVTPRRWLLLANPALSNVITDAIGDGWITDLSELARIEVARGRRRLPRRLPAGQA